MNRSIRLIAALLLAAGGVAWYGYFRTPPLPANSASTYVDPAQCAGCHAQIHNSYQHVGMARSFRELKSLSPEEQRGGSYAHRASGRQYQVLRRDGKLVQRRYEPTAFELEATHVIGSGNHARTYLHRMSSGEMVQLPLTWYTQERAWGMSPGYDNAAPPDFTRLVDDSCLFCHNGYAREGEQLAEGIDCQRCHGPGSAHVRNSSAASIVNPKRLSAELQMDICMQCHLETTSAELPQMLRRFGRTPFSFRPGEPLGGYMVHFDHAAGTGHEDKFEIVNQAYRLRQSACFLQSAGRMICSTCHNPHAVPRGAAAVSHYRSQCVACHSAVQSSEHPGGASSDCISCHMPKRRTEDAVHVVMTDHKIQRKLPDGDLTGRLSEKAVAYRGDLAIYEPGSLSASERDVYRGVALVSGGADRRLGIALLEKAGDAVHPKALAVLAEGYLASGDADAAIRTFQKALSADPPLEKARYNLGRAYEAAGRHVEAAAAFQQAIASQPKFPEAEYALGNVLVKTGDRAAAIQHYRRAIELRPVYAEARNNIANAYASEGKLEEARGEFQQALNIQPALAEAHNGLARVLAGLTRVPDALVHARRAVALKPDYAEGRYNLARLLQETGALNEAHAEYRRLLSMNPEFVEAHLSFGQSLADAGRLDLAIAEFREVLRLRPGHSEAQSNLSMALGMKQSGGR